MIFKFALRNVFRNRKRTILTAIAILTASMIVAVAMGWIDGMLNMLLDNYKKYQTGDLRITTTEFYKREKFMPVDELIFNSSDIISEVRKIPEVALVEERIKFGLILGHKDSSKFSVGLGIDFKNSILKPAEKLISGKLEEDGIYLGENLAKKLKVNVGEELLIATKTSEGGLNALKLRIKGIFKYNVSMIDDNFFLIDISIAKKLLKIGDASTEILIYAKNKRDVKVLSEKIKNILPEGVEVKTTKDLMGAYYDLVETGRWAYYFIYAIIVFLASFVVVNTMMMAVFERMKEIGTLKALGLTNGEMFFCLVLEGGIIGFFGSVIGGFLGYVINVITGRIGVNFEFVMKEITMPMEYIIRPEANIYVFFLTVIFGIIIPAISTMYPAGYAKKLQPAEALRK